MTKIIHIMQDGTKRESIEGIVIKNKDFYAILNAIQEKRQGVHKK